MAIWTNNPDGSLINFDGVIKWKLDGNKVLALHATGQTTPFVYTTAVLAAAAYQTISDLVLSSNASLGLRYITPNTGASGAPINAVLVGSAFAFDIITASFLGSVTIGGTAAAITYVNSTTLLLVWTPASAGSKDVVYTAKDGVTTVTLTGGFTAS